MKKLYFKEISSLAKQKLTSCLVSFVVVSSLVSTTNSYGNDLRITSTTFNQVVGVNASSITFQLSWKNSWRTVVNVAPNNWDAAWVFIKYRACGSAPGVEWSHAGISTVLANHTLGTLEPTTTTQSANDPTIPAIDGSAGTLAGSNKGIMLQRNAVGVYAAAAATGVTLRMTDDFGALTNKYDIKVFGIEMVFIPTGQFLLGDGCTYDLWNNNTTFVDSVNSAGTIISWNAKLILSESAVTTHSHPTGPQPANNTNFIWGIAGGTEGIPLAATFPKGYRSFYIMKYEITQDQYAQFLNTLPNNTATSLFPGCYNVRRNQLNNTGVAPNLYASSRPNRAQNYLFWHHIAAYMDWAACRPLSEMEYEKACRGPLPATCSQYAWGTNVIDPNNGLNHALIISTTVPSEDGTETILGLNGIPYTPYIANCAWSQTDYVGNGAMVGGDAYSGPVRVGIFATNASTQVQSGATYYGVMEMTGNVEEWYVGVSAYPTTAFSGIQGSALGTTSNNTFVRAWGDGLLDNSVAGDEKHNVNGWPIGHSAMGPLISGCDGDWNYTRTLGTNTELYLVNRPGLVGCRGGNWIEGTTLLRISSRYRFSHPDEHHNRRLGGRGGR